MDLIIIYDSKCRLSSKFAAWSRMSNPNFQTFPVRSMRAKHKLREFGIKFISLQTIYFVDNKTVLMKSKAVFRIMQLMPFPWKIIFFFKIFPLKFTDYLYNNIFAKDRYQF